MNFLSFLFGSRTKYIIPDRTFKMKDPETGKDISVERTIVKTIRPCNSYFSFGEVKWIVDENGGLRLSFEELDDITGVEKLDLPSGMEAILLECNMNFPYLPVKFNHPSIGNYKEIWIRKQDLVLVSGGIGPRKSIF